MLALCLGWLVEEHLVTSLPQGWAACWLGLRLDTPLPQPVLRLDSTVHVHWSIPNETEPPPHFRGCLQKCAGAPPRLKLEKLQTHHQ